MISTEQAQTLADTTVYGSDGSKIGKVGQVYLDDATGQVEWVSVHTGLFGTKEHFVPVSAANLTDQGLNVPFTAEDVKSAPSIDSDGHLSPQEEETLYRHYSLDYATGYGDAAASGGAGRTEALGTGTGGTVGYDTSGPTTDEAMTLSEEQVRVGTERHATGRARLRKYIVTEQQTVTVPVSHEEVRLEREPITEGNLDQALAGPELSEEEHEVVLSEERVVVNKETVPVERVRLDKETVTETQTVVAEARHEEVELQDETRSARDSQL